jgi:hypothetical protein
MADGKTKGDARFEVTEPQMRLIQLAIEHGYRACERGKNLQAALIDANNLYIVKGA